MTRRARLEMRVTPDLLRRIDGARGDVPRTRWVERALESALGVPKPEVSREDTGHESAPSRTSVADELLPLPKRKRGRPPKSSGPASVDELLKKVGRPSVSDTWSR